MESTVNQRILWQVLIMFAIGLIMPVMLVGNGLSAQVFPRVAMIFTGVSIVIIANLKFLFPRYYGKVSFARYTIMGILMCIGISVMINSILMFAVDDSDFGPMPPNIAPHMRTSFRYVAGTIPLLVALFSSTMYEVALVANRSKDEAAQLKSEKLEAELKFLKSQINPHFLFNALNNIYTLTLFNAKSAGDSILRLSEMLRYLLYECDAERVPIGRELVYLKNYITLFELKEEQALNIQLNFENVDEQVQIAPLLLIPFIENAFKHSQVEDVEKGWVQIQMCANYSKIQFRIINSLPKIAYEKDKVGGIGLQNVKRQLELIYPARHELHIEQKADSFHVNLSIEP